MENSDFENMETNEFRNMENSEFGNTEGIEKLKGNLLSSERGLSKSLTNLPKVTITDLAGTSHLRDDFLDAKSRSQPCSPRPTRRAFTTCIAGTRYVIGELRYYRNDPKFSDRYAWANSADPDQTAPRSSLIRVYTVCHSVCIVWTHYSMVEPHSSYYNKFFWVSEYLGNFMVY